MNVLITGGYGFIGKNLIPILHKEGYQIIVMNRSSSAYNKDMIHKTYYFDVKDEKAEEIFDNHTIDVVIHLAEGLDKQAMSEKVIADYQIGLTRMLHYASAYHVKRFIYMSTLDVYKDFLEPVTEATVPEPVKVFGKWKLTFEELTLNWASINDLDVRILRVGELFGPHQSKADFDHIRSMVGFVDEQFLHVKDLCYAINSILTYSRSQIFNLADGDGVDISLARKELYFKPKKTIEERIKETEEWFKSRESLDEKSKKKGFITRLRENKVFKRIMPFIENILTFIIVVLVNTSFRNRGIESDIDLMMVYIIVMATVYGLKQSSIAIVASIFYYIVTVRSVGETFLSATYNVTSLLQISIYIFIGTIIGYMRDSRAVEVEEKENELHEAKEKLNFLNEMYDASKKERSRLYDQILSSNDSFGKIYSIIQRLEALAPDKIYNAAIKVVEDILEVEGVFIYFMTQNQYYLRLISSSKDYSVKYPKSIHLESDEDVMNVVNTREMFVNTKMDSAKPMIILPIGTPEQIFAVIYIHSIQFESLNTYKTNLIKVVSNLITTAIERAYRYEQAIAEERYIAGTSIVKEDVFRPLVLAKYEEAQDFGSQIVVLAIESVLDINELDRLLSHQIRDFDFIGISQSKGYVLLNNTNRDEAGYVIKRFENLGIESAVVEEKDIYDLFSDSHHH